MKQAGLAYENLSAIYDSRGAITWAKLARARRLYTAFWVSDEIDERSKIIEACITLSESVAEEFEDQADERGLVETRNDLLSYYMEYHPIVQSNEAFQQLFVKSAAASEYVTSEFKKLRDDQNLLEALFLSINLMAWCEVAFPRPMFDEFVGKAHRLTEEIVNVSTRIGTPFSFCLASLAQCLTAQTFDEDMGKGLKLCLDAIPIAKKLRDSYLIGHLYTSAAVSYGFLHETQNSAEGQRDPLENQISFGETGLKFLQISQHGLLIDVSSVSYTHLTLPTI